MGSSTWCQETRCYGLIGETCDFLAVVLMIANVVTPAEAHDLEASDSHCGPGGTFDNSYVAPFNRKK
jgi:hypothetical protein